MDWNKKERLLEDLEVEHIDALLCAEYGNSEKIKKCLLAPMNTQEFTYGYERVELVVLRELMKRVTDTQWAQVVQENMPLVYKCTKKYILKYRSVAQDFAWLDKSIRNKIVAVFGDDYTTEGIE